MSRSDQNASTNDVVIQNARVLAIDQLADERADKPSVAKAVTLEVDVASGQKLVLASTVGTLSLMLRKAGELAETMSRRVTLADLGHAADPVRDLHFVTVGVTRASRDRTTACRSRTTAPVPTRFQEPWRTTENFGANKQKFGTASKGLGRPTWK